MITPADRETYHRLYGPARPRIAYYRGDALDYLLMVACCAVVIRLSYGAGNWIGYAGIALCAFMVVTFPLRHGIALRVPALLRRPQDCLYMLIYKLQNIRPMYLAGLAVLILDNWIIVHTPGLPHESTLVRKIAIGMFYGHFTVISLYRTVMLGAHLRRRGLVRDVLSQTSWKSALLQQPNMTLQIVHAYVTGLLTHIVLLAPWYMVLTHCRYSIITIPLICLADVLIHFRYLRSFSGWFYRDHWLSHNSEIEFLYLHGTHHDAIPSGLIAVSGNGFLEGFVRHTLGNPLPFYSPLVSFVIYTLEVVQDIHGHQYIPGVFPKQPRSFHETSQHSTHHFGRLEPYSIAFKMAEPAAGDEVKRHFQFPPAEILNSIEFDEQLTGFQWDNMRYRKFMELFDRYQGG